MAGEGAPTLLVTGAGSGIGRGVARLFLERGWRVGLMGRRPGPLEESADGAAGALVLPGDVSCPQDASGSVAAHVSAFGRLDVLFNNAGVFPPSGLIDEIPLADWERAVSVNLTGSFLMARAAFAAMRAQDPRGGRIITNGSVAAQAPRPGAVAYTATKHALTGLTRQLALDGRAFDIAAGQIDVGNADTEMAAAFPLGVRQADGSIRAEPVMAVADVAEAVWYMACLPLSANVPFLTVMPTKMPLIGRG
ncbi:MAG: SDR family oxidoreductase [Rhodobacteraceae bacterium]|nr:SDR family oxidoreductase [Paracoccaceae bacterium]